MPFEVRWLRSAERDLKKLDRPDRAKLVRHIAPKLEDDPYNNGDGPTKELPGYFKIRYREWRAVYSIEDNVVTIALVGNRKDVYDRIRERF